MSLTPLRIGFLPLVDAALPILAREFGFAEAEGLELALVRDMSWATVCDRLLYGHSDAAHLIAPLAIATTLGLGRPATPLSVPFVLGLNGNAITLRPDLAAQVTVTGGPGDVTAIGRRLAEVARRSPRLRFGVVHRYSSHDYMLRYWLMGSGLDPNRDVEIATVAPPFAADALASGEVDGICVGEPWNSVAVERGAGEIVAVATAQIWRRGVEKVLAMATSRSSRPAPRRRVEAADPRAGTAPASHFVDPAQLAGQMRRHSRPARVSRWLGGSVDPARHLRPACCCAGRGRNRCTYSDFMFQYREAANFPWVSQAANGCIPRWCGGTG